MATIQPVAAEFAGLADLQDLVGADRTRRMREAAAAIRERLGGGTLWHVNSTAAGGGVAEMLHTLLPLYRSLGVRAGWLVLGGDEPFFAATKRLGVALYGAADGGGPLAQAEQAHYSRTLEAEAEQIAELVGPEDVLLLHDHQTAGLADLLAGKVKAVYWRCHVGVDEPTAPAEMAWDFLAPLLDEANGLLFSVRRHVPARLRRHRFAVLPPFISPFSPKNRALDSETVQACLARCGLRAGGSGAQGRSARVIADRAPRTGEPLLTQVSRWDRLKDMDGVLTAFATWGGEGYLALVGPDPTAIPDDVEQNAWFEKCLSARAALPARKRERTALVRLPMADLDENALLVNGIQRAADVVVQKSLAEGFGLTVTEAMWKSRVVVASAVGGIQEQITHGHDGLLVTDPTDGPAFGALLAAAVAPELAAGPMGARAHQRVLRDFLPDREVVTTAQLLGDDRETKGSEQ